MTRHVAECNDVVGCRSPKQVQRWEEEASGTAAFSIEVTRKQHLKRKGRGNGKGQGEISGVGVPQL